MNKYSYHYYAMRHISLEKTEYFDGVLVRSKVIIEWLVPDDNKDWSVFCALCGKSWPGKTVCKDCEKLHKSMLKAAKEDK